MALVRKGTSHTAGGDIAMYKSTDDGATWGTETVIRNNAKDIRDVEVVTLANGDLLASFTERSEVAGTDFVPYVMRSTDDGATWGTAVAITHSFTSWGFISAKIIELPNGDLLAPLYGLNSGGVDGTDNYCRVSKSTDGGATWANLANIVAVGTSSRIWEEPCLTLDATGDLVCLVRSDNDPPGIYITKSTDDGATWSAPSLLFAGSGRPAVYCRANGDLLMSYRRQSVSTGQTGLRTSTDNGVTWSRPHIISGNTYVYGSFAALPSAEGFLWAIENSSTDADLKFTTLA